MSTPNDETIQQREYTQAELKQEANELFAFYRENPHDIKVEESEYYFHPSDYNDIRQPIVFVGEYAYYAALLTEFWCPKAIRALPFNITNDAQAAQLQQIVTYQTQLQQQELEDYKEKLLSSPLNMNSSEEEIQAKIDHLMSTGDITHLALNSKECSTGTTFRLAPFTTVDEISAAIDALKKSEITPDGETKRNVQDKPLLVIVLDRAANVKAYKHDTIMTLAPDMEFKDVAEENIAQLSGFVQGLPDVLAMFM